jgi:ribonuclease HI
MSFEVTIFTDGACRGNPGPGGWGALLLFNGKEKTISGFEPETTNNKMELMAAIEGLKALTHPCNVTISTDSKYVKDGITSWISKWEKNNWKTSNGKVVKNQSLWQELLAVERKHKVTWQWVRGHSGHPENERADALARAAIENVVK